MPTTPPRTAEAGLPVCGAGEFGPDGARFGAVATRDPDGQPVLVAARHGAPSSLEHAR
jgi:hypothetical protein